MQLDMLEQVDRIVAETGERPAVPPRNGHRHMGAEPGHPLPDLADRGAHGIGAGGFAVAHQRDLEGRGGIEYGVHRRLVVILIVLPGSGIVRSEPHNPDPGGDLRGLLERQRDIGQFAHRQEHELTRVRLPSLRDNEIHRRGPVEGGLAQLPFDLVIILFGAEQQGDPPFEAAHLQHAPRLRQMLPHTAAAAGAVHGDAFHVEHVAVEQQIGDRVLVVHLVVGVRIQDVD